MLQPWLDLFEELISIKLPSTHLSLLTDSKQRKLFRHTERSRELGLKHSEVAKFTFLLYKHISEMSVASGLPNEIWYNIIVAFLESSILERVYHCSEGYRCYPVETDGILKCQCFDISTLYRDVEKDSFIFQREEYQFQYKKLKLVYPPHLFSENWFKYGTVVEEFVKHYEKDRRKKYMKFFLFLFVLLILCISASKDNALLLLEIIQTPFDILVHFLSQIK